MKTALTVTGVARSERLGLVSDRLPFFFYQRVTEADLALATLDLEDHRYVPCPAQTYML